MPIRMRWRNQWTQVMYQAKFILIIANFSEESIECYRERKTKVRIL